MTTLQSLAVTSLWLILTLRDCFRWSLSLIIVLYWRHVHVDLSVISVIFLNCVPHNAGALRRRSLWKWGHSSLEMLSMALDAFKYPIGHLSFPLALGEPWGTWSYLLRSSKGREESLPLTKGKPRYPWALLLYGETKKFQAGCPGALSPQLLLDLKTAWIYFARF